MPKNKSINIQLGAPWFLLTLLFLTLRLTGIVAWSWWWVFAPLWIPLAFLAAFAVFLLFVTLLVTLFFICVAVFE